MTGLSAFVALTSWRSTPTAPAPIYVRASAVMAVWVKPPEGQGRANTAVLLYGAEYPELVQETPEQVLRLIGARLIDEAAEELADAIHDQLGAPRLTVLPIGNGAREGAQ